MIKGYVTVRSYEPIERPVNSSIGGFGVIVNGETYYFDWVQSFGYVEVDKNGFVEIEWGLKEFDEKFNEDLNNGRPMPSIEEIMQGEIYEVSMENTLLDENDNEYNVPFYVTNFEFLVEDEQNNRNIRFAFSPEQINRFNNQLEKERELQR